MPASTLKKITKLNDLIIYVNALLEITIFLKLPTSRIKLALGPLYLPVARHISLSLWLAA